MEARITRAVLMTALLLVSMGARQRSANFIVETADPRLAVQISEAAEKYRYDLAIEWLGHPMPNWSQPCPMTVNVGPNLGAGGATTFVFDRGEVFGWRMSIQGSAERIFDSVLPHEITHMIFASQFRQPVPRWADEGGATSVEHISERAKHQKMLDQFLRTGRGIAFSRMFAMTEYPADVMPLYAQGYSLAEFLIQTGGRRKYVEFLGDGLKSHDWPGAVARNYGIKDLGQLQNTWLAWVKQGSPIIGQGARPMEGAAPEMLAANSNNGQTEARSIYRQQGRSGLAQQAAIPVGRLAPVPGPALGRMAAADQSSKSGRRGLLPGRSGAAPVAAVPQAGVQLVSASSTLPQSGWKTVGATNPPAEAIAQSSPYRPDADSYPNNVQASQPPQTDPFQSQVTRPQDTEQPRQVILEWSAR
jgi:hypothetical protein